MWLGARGPVEVTQIGVSQISAVYRIEDNEPDARADLLCDYPKSVADKYDRSHWMSLLARCDIEKSCG